jgi:hypothetical protein
LRDVLSIGSRAAPVLAESLVDITDEQKELLRTRYAEVWRAVRESWPDRDSYVELHLNNIRAKTQKRSAVALGRLGLGDPLRVALDFAEAREYRNDVIVEIQTIFSSYTGIQRFNNGSVGGRLMERVTSQDLVPVAGAEILLRRCLSSPPLLPNPRAGQCREVAPSSLLSTQTDLGGEFSFPDLREGVYEVYPDLSGMGVSSVSPPSLLFLLVGDAASVSGIIEIRR